VPTGAVTVTATAGGASDSADVTVTAAPVTVDDSPSTASVQTGATKQFTATVTGSTATPVWSVNGVAGGNATVGTVSTSGLYTAPATVPTGAITVTATAAGASDSADVTVTAAPVTVDVQPPTATLQTGATKQFTATVTGSTATPAWSVNGVAGGNSTVGTVSTSGLYTAPAAVPGGGTVTVTATAAGASDSATVTVTAATNPPPDTRDPNALPAYDAFTGADQGPPIDSLWTGPLWSGQKVWKRISDQAGPSASGWNDTYATTSATRPVGIKMQVATPPPSGSIMFTWMVSSGFGSSPTGYAIRVGRGQGSGGSDDLQLQRWNGGGATWLAGHDGVTLQAGDWLALMIDTKGVEAFLSTDGTTWISIGASSDTSIPAPFRGGMETNAQTTRVDNVGYGNLAST
jgi:hypothetical protein